MDLNRRSFLAGAALAAAGTVHSSSGAEKAVAPFQAGEPVLQVPAETSMGVVWAVNGLANGVVVFADNPSFTQARRVTCGGFGVAAFDDRALQVRLTGLKPATRYWYRTETTPITSFKSAYHVTLGALIEGKVHSFLTPGRAAPARFCVMNDTHADWGQFRLITRKISELAPTVTLWNGDASNSTEDKDTAVQIFLTPPKADPAYASEIPLLFNNGNHDFRGLWNRHLGEVMMERLPSERSSRDWDLRRNFAVRLGDVALIGLDTGEDKPDAHPKWFGTANYSPYRQAQAVWLKEQLESPEIASAPFIVATCHIPLFDADPAADPGETVHPDRWAAWQKECAEAWGPLFEKQGVQVVVTAHRHRYRFDPACAERPWAQIVAGGAGKTKTSYPTVLEGRIEGGQLKILVHDVLHGRIAGIHTFRPRSIAS